MHKKTKDGVAEIGGSGELTNARLHEELTEGPRPSHADQKDAPRCRVPVDALDRVLGPAVSQQTATDPLGRLQPLYVVQERDIDLLLLEELHSNASFVEWFDPDQRTGLVFNRT